MLGVAPAEADLVEPAAAAGLDAEAARRNLGVEPALVAAGDVVEDLAAVGDEAREDVEPPGRALRVGDRGDDLRQMQVLDELDDVDAAALEHRPVVEVDLVELQLLRAVPRRFSCGQEGSSRAPGTPSSRGAGRGSPAGTGPRRSSSVARSTWRCTSLRISWRGRSPVLPARRPERGRRSPARSSSRDMTSFGLALAIIIVDYRYGRPGRKRHHSFSPLSRNTRQASATRASALISVSPAKAWARTGNHAGHRIIAEKNRIVSVPSARPAVK